ncbi:MAG: SMP-30/gluconolactonase/LRE family protein [Myxococcota bacterium]|jgi:sugar lactone lactonase YvrE|nr:SMP-30/gluconolactonase/LRE family protein [Myxococcota bacterium]
MQTLTPRILMEDLAFGEGPRWHEGRLYFSDMHSARVWALDLAGSAEEICRVPNDPSGLGWLPDGRLLVVSMSDRRLLRLEADDALSEVADLSAMATFHCNDMVVDGQGRAYVGNFGWDLHGGGEAQGAALILVMPDGDARVVAEDLEFPNGAVITPDGQTLIVAETMGQRLTAFAIEADGSLSGRRVWASTPGILPDGICLDAEGAIWVASPVSQGCFRVLEGGEMTHKVEVETEAFACMLGGPERKHLFVCTAGSSEPEACMENRDARIEVVEVEVPGAGLP